MTASDFRKRSRIFMSETSPGIYIVSAQFIFVYSILNQFQNRLFDLTGAFDQYVSMLSSGIFASPLIITSFMRLSGVVLAAALWMLSALINVGYISYALKISRGQDADRNDLLNGFYFFGKALVIHLLTSLFVFLWSLLLVFPGIMAAYSYRQAFNIMLDDPTKSPLQCIRESKMLMRGYRAELFYLDMSFFGWYCLDFLVTFILLSFLPFSIHIVSIWLTPYTHIANAGFYNHLLFNIAV